METHVHTKVEVVCHFCEDRAEIDVRSANKPLYEIIPPDGWACLSLTIGKSNTNHMMCPKHVISALRALPSPPCGEGNVADVMKVIAGNACYA